MTDALKQSAQQALDLLDLATNYHSNRDRAAETLRAALAAPQPAAPAQVEVFSEHDKGILRDLEAMAADKSSGFWPQILAVGSLRIIKRLAAPQWQPIETAPKEAQAVPLTELFSIDEIAQAAIYAEVSDGQFQSILIALDDNRRAHGIKRPWSEAC